jgi:hypothetical protein
MNDAVNAIHELNPDLSVSPNFRQSEASKKVSAEISLQNPLLKIQVSENHIFDGQSMALLDESDITHMD